MKKWIVMLAMLSLLTACAQTPEPAELTKLSAATSESADAEETAVSQQTSAPTAAPIATPEPTATPSAAPKLTVPPAPTPAPTAGTHSSADGTNLPQRSQHELWCCAL